MPHSILALSGMWREEWPCGLEQATGNWAPCLWAWPLQLGQPEHNTSAWGRLTVQVSSLGMPWYLCRTPGRLFACSAWHATFDIDGMSSSLAMLAGLTQQLVACLLPAGMSQRRVGSLPRLAEHCQCRSQDRQQLSSMTRGCRARTGSLLLMLLVQRASSSSTLRFMTRASALARQT